MTGAQKAALAQEWERYALPRCRDTADLRCVFNRRAPLTLEIGSGDGTCVFALAERYPHEDFVATEVYRPGLGRLVHRVAAAGVDNIRVSDQDVCDLLAPFSEAVFDRVLIFFPDPWPKKRHRKRRLLQREFFNLIAPRVHRHGRLFVATDCENYAESILDTVEGLATWANLTGPRRRSPRPKFRPITKFERKGLVAGSQIYDFIFARRQI
jgi:tRNA (guanine-N7-)-methyltransferase